MVILDNQQFWEAASDAFANDALELTILPTERCNLRCTYCYERFELGRMSDEAVESVKRLISRRLPELSRLAVDWFGGEPLLAMDVISEISGHAQRLADERPELDYGGSVTTNGVRLTVEVARRLADVGVRQLHVSLDGPADVHDLTRKLAGGSGTYAQIEQNLLGIRDSDIPVEISLRVHVTIANVDRLPDFTEDLISKFLGDERFAVYFFPIVDLGGPNQGDFAVLDPARAAAVVRTLTQRVNAARPKSATKAKKKGCAAHYVCYAAKPNAWVIRSDGRLAKCTVGFEDERNHIGRLLPDGTLDLLPDRTRIWLRGWSTGDALSLQCPYEDMREDVQLGRVVSRR